MVRRKYNMSSSKFMKKTVVVLAGCAVITGSFFGGAMIGRDSATTAQAALTTSITNNDQLANFSSAAYLPDYSELAEQCMKQVVSITNVIEVTSVNSGSSLYDFFYGGRRGSNSQTQTQEGYAYGSGVIIGKTDTELLLVTNNHVAVYDESGNSMYTSYTAATKELRVTFADGSEVVANLKGADADADIAVIAVNLSDISEETMSAIDIATVGSSDNLKVGQGVMAIGNALGLGQTSTFGFITALEREVTTDDGTTRTLMQTDAAINQGNSGGGLFNAYGQLIGINSAKYSGVGVEGIGYAIPISSVEELINNLMNEKTKIKLDEDERGYLGILGADVPASYVQAYGMPEGAMVTQITKGSPAEQSGLQVSDIITAVAGQKVSSYDELRSALSYYAVGEEVTLTVQRASGSQYSEISIPVTLANRADIELTDETPAETQEESLSNRIELQKAPDGPADDSDTETQAE